MTDSVLLSGLGVEKLEELLGHEAAGKVRSLWIEPGALAAGGQRVDAASTIVWLYRSPASELLDSGDGDSTAEVLTAWVRHNRVGLNLRKPLGRRLDFVDADRDLTAYLAAKGLLPPGDPQASSLLEPLVEGLLTAASHPCSAVHELLEAAAWSAPDEEPPAAPSPVPVNWAVPLLDAARDAQSALASAGGIVSELAARFEAACARLESDHVQTRTRLQSELESTRTRLGAAADGLRAELANERGALRSARGDLAALRTKLAETDARAMQLEAEVAACHLQLSETRLRVDEAIGRGEAAAAERDALRLQLGLMQDALAPAEPVPSDAARPRWRRVRRAAGLIVRRALRRPPPDTTREQDIAALRRSRWFDRDWYLRTYGDVAQAGLDPVEHFHDHGWKEGRDPGPDFSTAWYLGQHQDVRDSAMNPLLHFIRHGAFEGRLPKPAVRHGIARPAGPGA